MVDDTESVLKKPHKWGESLVEQHQRNSILKGLNKCNEDDVIILSDVDEIPDPNKISLFDKRKKYAVFLDSMIMHHEDYRMNYKYHTVPVTLKYFNEMNKFFDKIEKLFDLEVVIALHPNCNVKNYSKFFDYRKCIKSDTARLVRDSKFIFSHASTTAINFAIIYNKPIVYIITNEN